MPPTPPSPELIDQWIAGTLPPETAATIEAYFEEHPEELPDFDEAPALLSSTLEEEASGPDLAILIEALKDQTNPSLTQITEEASLSLLQSTDRPDLIGTLLHYEVIEVIAATGMGTVFKAWDPELDRHVAIKSLAPALAMNNTARRRFIHEARSMANLEHSHVLPIFAVHQDDTPWFVMRFIEGGTLQDALDQGIPRLRTPEFLESLARQISAALGAAHQSGIIHRDLKPGNILLDSATDHMWLTDFGIARTIEDPALTYGKTIPGTPRYMSPEQIGGGDLDARSDLFSLGSVLYHSATGEPPFKGENATAILHQVGEARTTPVARKNPNLPSWLAQLIDRLLSKSPSDRPADAGALLTALDEKKSPLSPRLKSTLTLLSLAALIAISLLGLFSILPEKAEPQASPPPTPSPIKAPLPVHLKNADQSFATLPEAVAAAAPGETLLLHGHLRLTAPLNLPPNITLAAADGQTPVIEFAHSERAGITTTGALKLRGLSFLSPRTRRNTFWFVTAIGPDAITSSHCHFEDRGITGYSWALSHRAVGDLTARSSTFRGPRLTAIHLLDSKYDPEKTPTRESKTTLTDSRFQNNIALSLATTKEGISQRIILERNHFSLNHLISTYAKSPLRPTKINAMANSIFYQKSAFLFRHGTLPALSKTVTWEGTRNTYFEATSTTPFADLLRPPQKIPTHKAFFTHFTSSYDSKPTFKPVQKTSPTKGRGWYGFLDGWQIRAQQTLQHIRRKRKDQ